MQRTFTDVAWVMALVSSVVLLAVAVMTVAIALATPAGSLAHLDAWRLVMAVLVALLAASLVLAALTLVRVRRGEAAAIDELDAAIAPAPAVVLVDDAERSA